MTGMAGIGKTALAQVLADQRLQEGKGEVLWIEVKYEKADAILEALADRFADDQISKLKHIDEKIPALKALLERSKVGLVVLENVHNVSAADKIVGAVPDKVPVLITSRQRFAVDQIVEVDVLSLGDALKILERTSGTKDLSNNSDAIFLCEQLGYHPYALELAGSMMRELDRTPKELRRRLADAPLDLSSSTRGRLRALLDDSAANLDASTRAVLFSFGVFPSNGATSNLLAAYLNKTVEDISNALDELVRRNLIKRRPETEFYFMHDLTYYYVRSQAKPDSEEDIRILVDGSLRYVVAHRRDFDVLGLDLPNLLAVAGSIHDVDLVKLVSYLTIGDYPLQEGKSYADQRGYTIGLIEQLDRAIEAAQSLGEECSPTTHYLLGKRGNAAFRRGHYQLAAEKYEEELRLSPNDKRKAITESILARTLAFSGRREDARQAFEAAHQIAEKLKDDELLDFVLEQESRAAGQLKDHATALVVAEKQLVLSEALYKSDEKNYERLANALINLGSAKLYLAKEIRGDASEALIAYERAIHLAEKHHDDYLLADAFSSLGEYYHYVGEHDRAQSNFGRALKILSSLELIKDAEDLKLLMQENGYDIPNLEGEAK